MAPSPVDPLAAFAHVADAEVTAAAVDGAVLWVSTLAAVHETPSWLPLDGAHPLDVLLGFRAPPHWRALGVSCSGRSYALDGTDRAGRSEPAPVGGPEPVQMTVMVDRDGGTAGVLRRGDHVSPMADGPQGAVADACRRALGVATAPAPASTLGLWTLAWLDRVVDAAARQGVDDRFRSWSAVARLHAAADPVAPDGGAPSPAALAVAAAALAEAWPWARLRAEPGVADVPGLPASAELAAWMDDGMWARWLLAQLPAPDDLVAAVHALLPPVLADGVMVVVRSTWPDVRVEGGDQP